MDLPRRSRARRERLASARRALVVAVVLSAPPLHASPCDVPAFHLTMIDSLPGSDPPVSLRVGTDGRPRVAYKLHHGPVKYASRTDAGWRVEIVDPRSIERNCELMLDAAGGSHVLYHAGVATRTEAGWSLNLQDWYYPEHLGGAIGPDGTVHAIVFQSWSGGIYYGTTTYMTIRGTSRSEIGLESSIYAFTNPNAAASLRLDSSGMARFCISTGPPGIRCWESLSSRTHPIPNARVGSIDLDADDHLHLAYYDTESRDLKYGVYAQRAWTIVPVDTDGDVGEHAALALDRSGRVHIAYYDRSAGDLKYAHRSGPAAAWTTCTVDAAGDVGSWASLGVDAEGHVHIAYWDATTHHVKYATTSGAVAASRVRWSTVKSAFR